MLKNHINDDGLHRNENYIRIYTYNNMIIICLHRNSFSRFLNKLFAVLFLLIGLRFDIIAAIDSSHSYFI